MKHSSRLVLCLLLSLLVGCMSVRQHGSFVAAGSPINNRATLLVAYHFDSVTIDGEAISLFGRGLGTAAWLIELLPGQHSVVAERSFTNVKLTSKTGRSLPGNKVTLSYSGTFMADAGKNYILRDDTKHSDPLADLSSGKHTTRYSSIATVAELPSNIAPSAAYSRTGATNIKLEQEQKRYRRVGVLHRTIKTK